MEVNLRTFWKKVHRRLFAKVTLYLVVGVLIGAGIKVMYDAEFPRKNIVFNERIIAIPMTGPYFGTLIDRTRNRACQVHSTEVLYTTAMINGKKTDVVLPLEDTGLFWPKLGRTQLLRLVPKPAELPYPGPWFAKTVSTDECHLWDMLFGSSVRESAPVAVIIPPPPSR
jgi:hypothetical protein